MQTLRGLHKRLFARFMAGALLDNDEQSVTAQIRRRLLADVHGDVLEIGAGSGANLALLAGRPDLRWMGVEPNPYMHPYLRAEASRLDMPVDLRLGSAEHLDAPDHSADAVICTHVLCSVEDQAAVLGEVLRVLRPGGRFVFIEHVAAPHGTGLRLMQNVIRPAWQLAGDGCHPNRETWRALQHAGFARLDLEHFSVPAPLVGPHIAGTGYK